MSDLDKLREEAAREKQKMSSMTFSGKISYIFSYYKLPIIIALVVLIIAVYLITHLIESSKKNVIAGLLVNVTVSETGRELLTDGYREHNGGGSWERAELYDNISLDFKNFGEFTDYDNLKIIALMSSGETDYGLINGDAFGAYAEQDAFVEVETLLSEEQLAEISDLLLSTTSIEKGTTYHAGIDVTDSAFVKEYAESSVPGEPVYLVFIANSRRMEELPGFFDYFLSLE